MHHNLDIHPIPEKVLYINELEIADTACYYDTKEQHQKALAWKTRINGGVLPDDNVRIYVPLDLNAQQILNRLQQIYRVMESPDDMNEMEFSYQVGKIISQLEIYDQVWVARDLGNAVKVAEHLHSKNGIELAGKIINILLEDEGCAESFPYDVVDELKVEFGIWCIYIRFINAKSIWKEYELKYWMFMFDLCLPDAGRFC